MIIKPIISRGYELLVKQLLIDPYLVACCEQNRLSFRIEGESNAPETSICGAAKPFHVCVFGIIECVNMRSAS